MLARGGENIIKDVSPPVGMTNRIDVFSLHGRNHMRMSVVTAAALALALVGFGPRPAEAEIFWSGIQNITASPGNSPQLFNGGSWAWGVVQTGPVHYAYFTPQDPGASPYVPYILAKGADNLKVDNLAVGTMIDGSTGGFWNSYPTNGGSQDNLLLWDFATATGDFPLDTDGYAAMKLSDGAGGFTYGWTEFRVNTGGTVTFIQQAFQSIPGVGIAVGTVPEIDPAGFGSALALALGALGMIKRKR